MPIDEHYNKYYLLRVIWGMKFLTYREWDRATDAIQAAWEKTIDEDR